MRKQIGLDAIDDLVAGAALLGTGGGGDPYLGALLCRGALERFGPVDLIRPDALRDDDTVFLTAAIGAPTILVEKLLSLEDADVAVRALEKHVGREASAIVAAEIGGINSTLPVAYAAMRGLPLVDGDGMGRAFPSLHMTTFNIGGVACAPLALADEFGERILIDTSSAQRAEEIARPLVAALGASATLSCYSMSGAEARRTAIAGSMSAAVALGAAIRGGDGHAVERLLHALDTHPLYGGARRLFDGKINDLERDTSRGWVFGRCQVEGLDDDRIAEVRFQNENLSVSINGGLRAIVPDLIMIVDRETAQPIPTESLRYGQRVTILACRAPAALRTGRALAVVGPGAFGLEGDYRSLEQLETEQWDGPARG